MIISRIFRQPRSLLSAALLKLRFPRLRLKNPGEEPQKDGQLIRKLMRKYTKRTQEKGYLTPLETKDLDLVILTCRDYDLRACASTLNQHARTLTYFSNPEQAWLRVSRLDASSTVFFIDIDSFDEMDNVVNKLIELRKCEPALTIVILSSTFARNDFTAERKAIADCSLRLPTTTTALGLSIGAARSNTRARATWPQNDYRDLQFPAPLRRKKHKNFKKWPRNADIDIQVDCLK
ncbi:hypothetical protein DS909_19325 [Phaeobacter gallaeciensis]|nr:hypothetical protein [Falsiruegeria litorea]MBT3141733.1 hypothetical protein [Falsiruegeria litorea]RBW50717.1 hypothetical protein DS909_19325 [Phaeobacter gallaeciensis]